MIISVPKGRIFKYFKKFLYKNNVKLYYNNRSFFIKTSIKSINIALVKSYDSFNFVKKNFSELGILGSDLFEENSFYNKNINFVFMNFFKCKLYLIRKKKLKKTNFLKLSTKYKNISKKIFKKNNIKVIKIMGSNEIVNNIDISDYIVDIVDTGSTLHNNNLKRIYSIKTIKPVIFFKKKKYLKEFIKNINENNKKIRISKEKKY
ncbi:ATP phosphoribosyltransferase [Candidatus Vidania fulgoroideorum]